MKKEVTPNIMQLLANRLDGLLAPEKGFILMVVPLNGEVGDRGEMVSSINIDDVATLLEGFAVDLRAGTAIDPEAGGIN